jgi:hypothetical protein
MDHSVKSSEKRWHRKAQVAARYNVCGRTIDRAVEDGRLPPPKYPLGPKIPYWDGDDLDAHDRASTLSRPRQRKSEAPASAGAAS